MITLQLLDPGHPKTAAQAELADRERGGVPVEADVIWNNLATRRRKLEDLFAIPSTAFLGIHCPVSGMVDSQKAQRVS